jgi:hypothetical protein
MARTRQDLISSVLEELGALGAGQTPDAEDVADIEKRLDSTFAELAARGVWYVQDDQVIDDAAYNALVAIVADMASPAYGQPRNAEAAMNAETRLRRLRPSMPVFPPVRVDYF